MTSEPTPAISVVICVYNDSRRLQNCLDALENQADAPPFEVIVVDDGSIDNPKGVVLPHLGNGDLGITFLEHGTNRGLSAARNTGIAASRAPLIAFVDSDCVPPEDWLATMTRVWNEFDDGVVALSGIVVPFATDTIARRYAAASPPLMALEESLAPGATLATRFKIYLGLGGDPHGRRRIFSVVGANMSIRADALAAIGGFDEQIRFGGDEVQCCEDLRAAFGDSSIMLEPSLVMRHDFDPSMRDVFRRARSYGRGGGRKLALHGGHPELRPYPFALLASGIAVLLIRPRRALQLFIIIALLMAMAIWRRLIQPRSGSFIESFSYPLIFAACELISTVGFAEGWMRHRTVFIESIGPAASSQSVANETVEPGQPPVIGAST